MSERSLKTCIRQAHRWVGLVLTPLFLLMILSGALLAGRPILGAADAEPPALDISMLTAALNRADPQGLIDRLKVQTDGTILLQSRGHGPNGALDLETGILDPDVPFDFFHAVERFHKGLMVGLEPLIQAASYALLGLVLVGPLLSRPRLGRGLMGWHVAVGWFAWPLLALLPITAVLMTLHVGGGTLPPPIPSARPVSLVGAIEQASRQQDLSGLIGARHFRGGSVLLKTRTPEGEATLLIDSRQVTRLNRGNWVHALHEGTWGGAGSGLLNLLAAFGLGGLSLTGAMSWWRRHGQSRGAMALSSAGGALLIAHASQTGTAARLAETARAALAEAGHQVPCLSLAALTPADLERFNRVMLIVSTAGDGDIADPGRSFLKALGQHRYASLRFAILALGDRRHRHFCGGGERLRDALLSAGAQEWQTMQRVDGDPSPMWSAWWSRTTAALRISAAKVVLAAQNRPVTLRLESRRQLNDPGLADSNETWSLDFRGAEDVAYRPGDLLLVSPAPDEPERCYSIGSAANDTSGLLRLTVTVSGRMSSQLCHEVQPGQPLPARIRHHPEFNPPDDPSTPIIMVAAGCGVAPFIGFLAERANSGKSTGGAWLLFGNRHRTGDFLYADEWQRRLADRSLTRLDTAFSRDAGEQGYVTDRAADCADKLLRWMKDTGAILYICGRARLGAGVEQALRDGMARHWGIAAVEAEATWRQWQAEGRVRQDLFD